MLCDPGEGRGPELLRLTSMCSALHRAVFLDLCTEIMVRGLGGRVHVRPCVMGSRENSIYLQGFPLQSITEISLSPRDPSSSQSKLATWEEISAINLCVYVGLGAGE